MSLIIEKIVVVLLAMSAVTTVTYLVLSCMRAYSTFARRRIAPPIELYYAFATARLVSVAEVSTVSLHRLPPKENGVRRGHITREESLRSRIRIGALCLR